VRGMTVAAPEWHGYEQSAHRYRFPRMQEWHERSDRVPADVCSSSAATACEERFRRAGAVCHKGIRCGTTAPEAEAFPAGFQALAVAKVRAFRWQSVTA
jgi:hypothetical protein